MEAMSKAKPRRYGFRRLPTIALSAKWESYPDRFRWLAENQFALEYAPNPRALNTLPEHVDPLLEAGVPVRYHGFFPGYEFGHADAAMASVGTQLHLSAQEAMCGRGEQVITVHIGLHPQDPIDPGRAVENLSRIVEHGRDLGITVCLENLRRGSTSDPEIIVQWARESGAMLTLDVGHATSSRCVQEGAKTALDFVELFADRLVEVHMYEREAIRHYPPQDMAILGPIVDRLLETQCTWWTIELDSTDDALSTRALLFDYTHQSFHIVE
jgi:sugar phosphate isomerase/epimerase